MANLAMHRSVQGDVRRDSGEREYREAGGDAGDPVGPGDDQADRGDEEEDQRDERHSRSIPAMRARHAAGSKDSTGEEPPSLPSRTSTGASPVTSTKGARAAPGGALP